MCYYIIVSLYCVFYTTGLSYGYIIILQTYYINCVSCTLLSQSAQTLRATDAPPAAPVQSNKAWIPEELSTKKTGDRTDCDWINSGGI